jgi:hypothetical protein
MEQPSFGKIKAICGQNPTKQEFDIDDGYGP